MARDSTTTTTIITFSDGESRKRNLCNGFFFLSFSFFCFSSGSWRTRALGEKEQGLLAISGLTGYSCCCCGGETCFLFVYLFLLLYFLLSFKRRRRRRISTLLTAEHTNRYIYTNRKWKLAVIEADHQKDTTRSTRTRRTSWKEKKQEEANRQVSHMQFLVAPKSLAHDGRHFARRPTYVGSWQLAQIFQE